MQHGRAGLPPPAGGVFITRSMGIRIPPGGLVIGIGADGGPESSLRLQVARDMCPYWLEIAVAHLSNTYRMARAVGYRGCAGQGRLPVTARLRFIFMTPFFSSQSLMARRICSLLSTPVAFLHVLQSFDLLIIDIDRPAGLLTTTSAPSVAGAIGTETHSRRRRHSRIRPSTKVESF